MGVLLVLTVVIRSVGEVMDDIIWKILATIVAAIIIWAFKSYFFGRRLYLIQPRLFDYSDLASAKNSKTIGLMHDPDMSDAQRALIAEKRRAYEENRAKKKSDVSEAAPAAHQEDIEVTGDGVSFPPSATMCHKCSAKAIVIMDGCATCLNCGYSKCG